ncbi:MAG: DUF5698 domain-containing protein [Bradymonadales bacterium]|jgi:uncharacterized protein YebE (UPF0316 family)
MIELLDSFSLWQLALSIFVLRICDVSLGTMKTISVVQGRIPLAFTLGFFEVLIWVSVIAQVISRLGEHPILAVAYAGGYAAGNAMGIIIERYVALGTSVVRFISQHQGHLVAKQLRENGQAVTTFDGEGRDGHCLLIYAICTRKDAEHVISIAKEIDPNIFYIVESVTHASTLRSLNKRPAWRIFSE